MSADVLPLLSHVRVLPPTPVRVPSPAAVLAACAMAYEEAQLRADSGECDENCCPHADDRELWPLDHACRHCGGCEQDLAERLGVAVDELAAALVAAGLADAVAQAGAL